MSQAKKRTKSEYMSNPLVRFLIERNKEQSELFCSPDETFKRRQYRAQHPTEIAALKCMDGRLHLPVITKTPLGIIQPFRNLGGRFILGWPYFGTLIKDWVNYSISQGRSCLVFVTYHWSKGSVHRGCRGFDYDVKLAMKSVEALKRSIERVFGEHHQVVYPITLGIETDSDALILHGLQGEALNLSEVAAHSDAQLKTEVRRLFPDMQERMLDDLIPLLLGNREHIKEVAKRPLEQADHQEQILGVGRGFDWLHLRNKALLIGPYSWNINEPIVKAAGVLLDNLKHGRIPREEGFLLIASAAYRDPVGHEIRWAEQKARDLARFTLDTIHTHVPELVEYLETMIGVVDLNTRLMTRIELD